MILDKTVSAPHMASENNTEKTNTIITKRCSSDRSVQATLFLSSSKESLM